MKQDKPARLSPLPHTAVALKIYDEGHAVRETLFYTTRGDDDAWGRAVRDAIQKVQDAFFEDTKDHNSRDNCCLVSIGWLKQQVAKHGPHL